MSDLARSAEVEALATEPPVVVLTKRQKWERAIAYLAILFSVFAFGLSTVAISRVGEQSQCTNNILGDRQKVSDTPAAIEEAAATAEWSEKLLRLFTLPKDMTADEKAASTAQFLADTTAFANHLARASATLQSNAVYRAQHPLGKC